MMPSPSALLLGACSICGEPIFRHRLPNGRQISCAAGARIDQQLRQSGAQPPLQSERTLQVLCGGGDRDGDVEAPHA